MLKNKTVCRTSSDFFSCCFNFHFSKPPKNNIFYCRWLSVLGLATVHGGSITAGGFRRCSALKFYIVNLAEVTKFSIN